MGITSNLLFLIVGTYTGIYLSQNYEIPKMPSPTDIQKNIKDYLENYKKK